MAIVRKQKKVGDKKKHLREEDHLTTPPRMEGKVKNKMMNPVRKQKKAQEKGGKKK